MRVIAFGYSEEPLQENCISGNLVLIGLAAIRDDVRQKPVLPSMMYKSW